jgi:hypothetical protein
VSLLLLKLTSNSKLRLPSFAPDTAIESETKRERERERETGKGRGWERERKG